MDGWMDGWMDVQKDECTEGLSDRWMDGMDGHINEWTNG